MKARKTSSPRRKTEARRLAEKVSRVSAFLKKTYPAAKCHLNYSSAFELLVGSILSAQCTDKRVNSITPDLFKNYPDPQSFAGASAQEIEKRIYSAGFYRNKAKAIVACSGEIVRRHGGSVPSNMAHLSALPGVGRKTANVVLGNWFGKPGIIVDTHITRLSKRLGIASGKTPEAIERQMMGLLPESQWTFFSNSLGDHGREICKAKNPLCGRCGIRDLCLWSGKDERR